MRSQQYNELKGWYAEYSSIHTDHQSPNITGKICIQINKNIAKNLEHSLNYSVFHSQGEKVDNFENIFFSKFKLSYFGHIQTSKIFE